MNWILAALNAIEACEPIALVTIAKATGSTPRLAGTKMLVFRDRIVGSIGGGQLEFQAIEAARELAREGEPARRLIRQILGPDLGQCCGGAVSLLVETIGQSDLEWLTRTEKLQNSDQAWLLVTPERGPKIWLERPEGDALGLKPDDRTTLLPRENGWRVIERIDQSRTPLWLFGAGHVGRALVRILADLPFAVTWIDSRQQEFPVAVPTEIDARISRRAAEEVAGAPHGTMFLVMTHSHELDFEICDRVLRRGDFAFLGLIGSATKRARFVHRFGEKGYNSAQLERLVCPIGLGDVPGKEPMAIAVAVAGQLLALRARLKAKLNEASPEAERGADIGAA